MRDRVRKLNDAGFREKAEYVHYGSQMNRRAHSNHALDYAIETGNESQEVRARGAGYAFYLRRRRRDANNAVYELAKRAAAVVTDDSPTFIAAIHTARVPFKTDVAYFAVDSSCAVPMNRFTKRQYAAYTIRPKINRVVPENLHPAPELKPRKQRDPMFSAEQMEQARTYDPLWNAAQKELLMRGRIRGYYRMCWGKKIIEWSRTYQEALALMIHPHDGPMTAHGSRDPSLE